MPPELNVEDELCPECEGVGLMDCPECGGTGEEYEKPCEECAGQCTVPCYSCDGSGSTTGAEGGMENHLPNVVEPSVRTEGFTFDRFMDDIIIKEGAGLNKKTKTVGDSPQRARARKHQERPLGRIRYGVK
jgi:hypothetical protein